MNLKNGYPKTKSILLFKLKIYDIEIYKKCV